MEAGALARGVSLFNRGLYWEAHEAWEELWLELSGEPRLFVQGLIQLAAAYHKATVQRQPRGCVSLHLRALQKLAASPRDLLGVETEPLLAAARLTLAAARRWLAGEVAGLDAASLPRITLR